MKDIKDAEELSRTMINIGKLANKETVCVITNMDQPLGSMVGNTLEIIEAIEALKGNMQEDVRNVVLELGAYILKLDGKGNDIEENKKAIEEYIRKQLQEDIATNQISIKEYVDPFEKEQKEKERKIKKELGPLKW